MSIDFHPVLYKAEFLLLEHSSHITSGPKVQIAHRFRLGPFGCQPGEEVFQVSLLHRGRQTVISLSLALRLLFNYLATYRRTPQSATQIASGINASEFYALHGINAGVPSRRNITRTAIKEYIKRIRQALAFSLREAGIPLRSSEVLIGQATVGNEVLYRLRAAVEWIHLEDLPTLSSTLKRIRNGRMSGFGEARKSLESLGISTDCLAQSWAREKATRRGGEESSAVGSNRDPLGAPLSIRADRQQKGGTR